MASVFAEEMVLYQVANQINQLDENGEIHRLVTFDEDTTLQQIGDQPRWIYQNASGVGIFEPYKELIWLSDKKDLTVKNLPEGQYVLQSGWNSGNATIYWVDEEYKEVIEVASGYQCSQPGYSKGILSVLCGSNNAYVVHFNIRSKEKTTVQLSQPKSSDGEWMMSSSGQRFVNLALLDDPSAKYPYMSPKLAYVTVLDANLKTVYPTRQYTDKSVPYVEHLTSEFQNEAQQYLDQDYMFIFATSCTECEDPGGTRAVRLSTLTRDINFQLPMPPQIKNVSLSSLSSFQLKENLEGTNSLLKYNGQTITKVDWGQYPKDDEDYTMSEEPRGWAIYSTRNPNVQYAVYFHGIRWAVWEEEPVVYTESFLMVKSSAVYSAHPIDVHPSMESYYSDSLSGTLGRYQYFDKQTSLGMIIGDWWVPFRGTPLQLRRDSSERLSILGAFVIEPPLQVIQATTSEGRSVLLKSDGTWEYDTREPFE